jgi:hypothetical protein
MTMKMREAEFDTVNGRAAPLSVISGVSRGSSQNRHASTNSESLMSSRKGAGNGKCESKKQVLRLRLSR